MKKFFEIIKKLFHSGNNREFSPPQIEINTHIELIKKIETNHPVEPGRRIHSFEFLEFELGVDLEITGTYRVVVFEGKEKRYSFSIRCQKGEYDKLTVGLRQAVDYLSGKRKISDLPNDNLTKGHYFGV